MNASTTTRPCIEAQFGTDDGTQLFYRYWPAASHADEQDALLAANDQDSDQADMQAGNPATNHVKVMPAHQQAHPATRRIQPGHPVPEVARAVVLFHRGHEHGGRIAHLVDEMHLPDCAFFAWDARGLGRSPGARGQARNFGQLVKDVDCFIRHISKAYHIATEHIAIIAQSVGAVLVASWVHDYAPNISSMVLAAPAFKVKLYVPLARPGLKLLQNWWPRMMVNSYVKPRFLTHDAARIAAYQTDALITRPIAVNVLLGLYEAAERVIDDAGAITVPTQMLISGADWVVHQAPQHEFMRRLGSPINETHVFPGFFHDTLGEQERHLPIAQARRFVLANFHRAQSTPDLRQAHRHGATLQEYQRLIEPPSSVLARARWAIARLSIQIGSHFSAGLRLSRATGFDSGSTLDYVYRNQSQGLGPVGRLVDSVYLNSIGWRGIRTRKQHLQRMIARANDMLVAHGAPLSLVDIAAGHGRYVLEAVSNLTQIPGRRCHVLLRDYSDVNVRAGQRLIAERGLRHLAQFEAGDAFDRTSLAHMAQIDPAPNLAVVSGLYELFSDNQQVMKSLLGLADALPTGAYLIYTNQPWHPQLELIARTLTSHRQGQPWVMRRRTQAEMDQLVADAGFIKLDQLSDEWGIFSVSLARRV